MVRIPPQLEDDEEVAADVMWSVCVFPGKTSFTNEDNASKALKKMNEGHEEKGVGKEDNAEVAKANEDNDKVVEATEDEEKRRCQMPEPRVVVTNLMGMTLPCRVGSTKA